MRSQIIAALCFLALIFAGISLGLIGGESHADESAEEETSSAEEETSSFDIRDIIPAGPSGNDPSKDEVFPLQPYALIPDLDGQVAYGSVRLCEFGMSV